MLLVLLQAAEEDEDIIQIDVHKPVQQIMEDIVDEGLEDSWSVGESKQHHHILEVAKRSIKRRLPFVSFLYAYQLICVQQVQLGEDSSTAQELEQEIDEGQGILVFDSDVVKTSVINAWTE